MALKDWKKDIRGSDILFEHKFKDDIDFEINKVSNDNYIVEPSSDNKFNRSNNIKIKQFKTKSAALKFAKSYMRKN